jgi:hypothetical protein
MNYVSVLMRLVVALAEPDRRCCASPALSSGRRRLRSAHSVRLPEAARGLLVPSGRGRAHDRAAFAAAAVIPREVVGLCQALLRLGRPTTPRSDRRSIRLEAQDRLKETDSAHTKGAYRACMFASKLAKQA